MKKPTFFKLTIVVLFILLCFNSIAQTYKTFSIRKNLDVKGSMLVVGNNILGKDNLSFNDNTKDNQDISMQYIDIDSDASTFNSSSAELLIPMQKDGSPTTCYRVAYAALYWGAMLQNGSRTNINKVKIKLPGSTIYNDITGEIIYDAIINPIVSINNEPGNSPYACYADVTNLLSGLSSLEGDYTVANVTSSVGFNASTGLSAGWTLFVIYEDPNLHTKSFTSFDGFSHIYDSHYEEVPVTGFTTPQAGPIDLQFAYAALDGDKTKRATKLEINGKEVTTPLRPANKFFGSVIENTNGVSFPRNPDGTNTLGYDTGFLEIIGAEPEYIKNNESSASFTLQVARGQADPIFAFFSAFAVDIIAPDIDLTKIVLDASGNDIDGADVVLGQNLFYEITYQSIGNDNVTQFTIKDVLPDNIVFDPLTDIDLSNAGGATLQSYDPATRTLIFNIPDTSVQANDPAFVIRIAVQVVPNCYDLSQACSNEIMNQAFATYRGVLNTAVIQDEGSFASVECLGTPGSTNFLVDISNCNFERDEVLCGSSVLLTASNGYDSYSWSRNPSGTPIIGTGQTFTATETGAYYVSNITSSTCISIDEKINVIPFGNTVTNPVIPFADLLPICPNDGKVLPYIFLCGANATRSINTGISDASSVIWEKLDENSCPSLTVDDCANENSACTWNQVATGSDYVANTSGQFRIVINYTGGCFSIFYFNVYQNLLNPTATSKDIICTTPGEITVGGVPSGYEYSIDGSTYQTSNVFSINTANYYIIYIRQIGVDTNPCIFETPSVYVRNRDFTVTTFVTQPYCYGDKGSIKLAANDALPQYYFSILEGGTLVNSVGPIMASDYTFANLNTGTYTYTVSTDDGCTFTDDIIIIEPLLLTATVALTKPLTCTDGELTVYPVGGTPPYIYYVNSTSISQDSPVIVAPTSGLYDITVIDSNNCSATTSITVEGILPPEFTVDKTDVLCAGFTDGTITFNVNNANGNTLEYSIDGGTTFFNSPVFTGLSTGSYSAVVQYTIDTDVCLSAPQPIIIAAPTPITGTATTTPYTCSADGSITVSGASGGTGTLLYSIDGVTFQAGNTFTGLTDGTYTITIQDANNCTFVLAPITLDPLDSPTDLSFISTALTCPTNTSDVSITTTGGVGTLEYQIIAPSGATTIYQSSNIFTGLAPGTYTFQVRDANDCTYSEPYTIVALTPLTIVGQTLNDVSCFGLSDGSVQFTVSGTSTFTYAINGGASLSGTSPINLTGLSTGAYAIVITDTTTGCQASASVFVDTPATALSVTTTESPVTCNADGSVVITAIGGWGGYTYELALPDGTTILGPQGSNVFSNLTQIGLYTATVTDAKGCQVIDTFTLNAPTNPTASIINADYCYDAINGASLEVNASGGQPPYEYSVNGGAFQLPNIFTNLTPGTYDITVRDSYGCLFILPTETIAPQVTLSTVLTKELDCTASPDGLISGTISDGYAPYTVTLIQGTGTVNLTGNTFTLTTGADGAYQFQVTDSNGCQSVSNVITINPIIYPTATTTTVNLSCNGDVNGSVQIIPADGVGPYTYSFNGSSFTSTSLYTGFSAGTYPYQVQDANTCIFNGTVTLTEPTALVVSASATAFSCSASNAVQSATVIIDVPTTGTAPYLYSFNGSGYSSNNTLTVNDNGTDQTITFSVQDAQGCTDSGSLIISRLDPPNDLDFVSTAITCNATSSTVTLTATNGVGSLQYETIAPSPIIIGKQASNSFSGLTSGTYIFRVTDANGCYYTESYTIDLVTPIAVTGLKLSDVLCNGDATGAIQFTVYDSTGFTYTINGGASTVGTSPIALTGLPAGNYTIVVTDTTTGCTATETITINEPVNPLSLSASATNVHCNNDNSQITVTASGGTINYVYAAVISGSPAPTAFDYNGSNIITVDTNTATNLVWDVYVKDANDCIAVTTVTIIEDSLPTVTTPVVDNQCTAESGFTFTATGTGVAPLSYSINGGASYQTSPTFTVNTAGNFTITIRDGNGCTATGTGQTEVFSPIRAYATLTKDITCDIPTAASIDITASGGNAPYTYEVSTNGGSAYSPIGSSTYTTSTAGTYQFRVTDANGCSQETVTVNVTTPINPVIINVSEIKSISCNGDESAAIDVIIDTNSGLAPFVINVYNTTTSTDYDTQTSGLAAGIYTITVTDAKGCTDTDAITISEPEPLVLTYNVEPITCIGGGISLGRIYIDAVTGGTPTYTYHVTGVNGYNNQLTGQTGATQVFDVVNYGYYEIIITDANGCSVIQQNILVASPPDNLDIMVNSTADCTNGGNAVVSIGSTLSGNGPFYFAIYDGSGNMNYTAPTSAPWQDEDGLGSENTTFTGLIPGATYTFIVYAENTKCYYYQQASVPIPTDSTLGITSLVASNITCKGNADGIVSFDVGSSSGSSIDVTYTVYNVESVTSIGISGTGTIPAGGTLTVTDLGPLNFGRYFVLVREDTGPNAGCSVASSSFNITESAISLSVTAQAYKNENCNELGIITATGQDGTAPYEYQAVPTGNPTVLTDWLSSNTFNLSQGTYDIYIRDAYGCTQFVTESIIKDPEPTIDPIPQQCYDGTTFSISLVEGTGTAITPLTYSIGGAFQSSPNFTINALGTYTASIKDGNGCIASTTYVVEEPVLLGADLTQDLTCSIDASISLTATGGTGIYNTHEVNFNGGGYAPIPGTTYTATIDGTYQFRVTDSQGCQAISNVIIVTPKTTPTFTYAQTNVSCYGGSDGSIVITAADGIAPYQYSIDNGSNFQSSNVFSGLSQDTYDVVVRDSKNCDSLSVPVTINEPISVGGSGDLTQGLTCGAGNATQPAIVTITGSGGTAPYTYSFNGGLNYTTTSTYTTYAAGTVTAYIKDANGCIIATPIDVDIPALDVPTDLTFVATPVTCDNTTSEVTLTATNGVGALTYEIISPIAVGPQASNIFTGLAPNTYVFTVTDANGCYYTESYTVVPVTNITVSGLLFSDVNCNGGTDGSVEFTVSNFATAYSYTINGGAANSGQTSTTINLTGLSVGDQTIVVTDETTGCTATATVTVSEPTLLTLVEATNINANCNFGAQVTVTASGGTMPYQYAFVQDAVPVTAGDYSNINSAVLDPATNSNWDVWVMDSNGCTAQIDVVINTDPLPSITVPTLASNQCNLIGDPYTFTVTDPTGIPPFTYSIGNGFQSSPTFTVSTPGTYNVTVKDGNGCTAVGGTSITIYTALDLTPAITALPSCTNDDGVITITGSGGSGIYSYSINPSSGTITGNVISGLPSGIYTVTILDTITNCTKDATITLDAATPVTFTKSPTDVSCNGSNDGTITVNLPTINDNPPYTYAISGPVSIGPQNSNVFTGLPAGIYDVTVTSSRNCSLTQQETINEPALLTVSGTATDFACAPDNSVNTSELTITEVGGTAPFTYSIDGINYLSSNTFYIIDTGSAQTIDIFVKDNNGCMAQNSVSITPLPALTSASVNIVTPIDCNNTGSVEIIVSGGSGDFSYQMLPDGSIQLSNVFAITSAGDYYFRVFDTITGCYIDTPVFTVVPFDTIDAVATATTQATCFGDTNGAFELNVSGYSGAYNYEIFNDSGISSGIVAANTSTNPQVITGMSAGNYTVVVTETESPFCAESSNVFTIGSPPTALTLIAQETSNVTCDNDKGTITAVANGGWGSYEYELTGAATVAYSSNGTFTGLSAGSYIVNARDAGGCIVSDDVVLIVPPPITAIVTPSTNLLSCFGDTNATITISNVTGGQGENYSYTLNTTSPVISSSGPQSSPVFTGLGAGTYNVTVTDGYNCEFTSADIIIAEPTVIQSDLVKATSQTCLTDATLTLSATGGTAPYTYSDDINFGIVSGAFVSSVTFNVLPGTYAYYVRDANGCITNVSNDITIDPLPLLTVGIDTSNATINCTGDTTGVIVATAQGGLGNYVYTLQDDTGTNIPGVTQNSPGVFTDLSAGTYQVRVDSGDCLTTSSIITITEPATALTVSFTVENVNCPGNNNGSLEINASGGTGIIKYAISPRFDQFFETSRFENLMPGNYQAMAQDELGCFVIFDFIITEPAPVMLTIVSNSIIPEVCDGDLNGEFSIDISGATLPYSVVLDDINGTYTTGTLTQTQFDFTGLDGGDHTVFVRDALGCESEWNITFPESVKIEPVANIEYGCSDNTSTNTVTVTVDASITNLTDLDYSLDGAPYQASNIFTNIAPGLNHYIDVRHTNGCIQRTADFDISTYDPLALILNSGTGINEIVAVTTGGAGGYQYTLNGEDYGSTNTFIIYKSGDYTVTVTDSNGCFATATKYFEYIDVCIPNYFTPDGDGNNDGWGPGCATQYRDLTFDIFDRYGRKIATLRIGDDPWDGKYQGKELPSGDYWYVVHLNDKKDDRSFVGHFTLYR